MLNDVPFDHTNCKEMTIERTNTPLAYIGPWGEQLTAEYIRDLPGDKKEELLEWLFQRYRKNGFPYPSSTDAELRHDFKSLIDKDENSVLENGEIKNYCSCATNIIKHFCGKEFYAAKGSPKSFSCIEVFNNDEKLKAVLKNRIGWAYKIRNGEKVSYNFPMSDSMLIQGMRSSALAHSVSQFKPSVAKFIYSKYAKKRVFDYSAGWGARALGAISLGLEYYAVDPLTANPVNRMIKFFGGTGKVLKQPSEEGFDAPECDFVFSSPPYFNLETYSLDSKQSLSRYPDYNNWLEGYWRKTVRNCLEILSADGKFGVAMVPKVGKHEIADDIVKICEEEELNLIHKIPFQAPRSHLTSKFMTRVMVKATEAMFIFERK